MRDVELGRIVRALRMRLGWRQVDLAARAGVHRSVISRVELGKLSGLTFETVRRVLDALNARMDIRLDWHGPELSRLLDADHASLVAAW
ncbi:MAG: helix-turn-helix domain-containing protein [Candidatus Limnocylindria bacterium]